MRRKQAAETQALRPRRLKRVKLNRRLPGTSRALRVPLAGPLQPRPRSLLRHKTWYTTLNWQGRRGALSADYSADRAGVAVEGQIRSGGNAMPISDLSDDQLENLEQNYRRAGQLDGGTYSLAEVLLEKLRRTPSTLRSCGGCSKNLGAVSVVRRSTYYLWKYLECISAFNIAMASQLFQKHCCR